MQRRQNRILALIAILAGMAGGAGVQVLAQPSQSPPMDQAPAPAPQAPKQCFSARNVNSFIPVDDTHVNLRVGVKDMYQLTLFAPCRDLDWTWRLGVRARGGSDLVCSGLDAEIIVPDRNFPQRCLVSGVRKLTPDEVETTPSRFRP